MSFAVRTVQSGNADAIAGLLAELGYPTEVEICRRRITHLARNAVDRVFVAVAGEEVLGLVSLHLMPMFHRDDYLCRITALVVAKRYHGMGVGRLLVEAAVAFCRNQKNCFRLEVTSGNHRHDAHAFYQHVGFTQVGPRFYVDI